MLKLPLLLSAVFDAYNNALPGGRWAPKIVDGQWWTYCNEAFNSICKRIGYKAFDISETAYPYDAFRANRMFDEMVSNGDWHDVIDGEVAQSHANDGSLVAAIWKNPTGASGHVCVVIPGVTEYSGTWGKSAPMVMNIGRDVFIGKKASYAFRSEPKFFVLKSTLEV